MDGTYFDPWQYGWWTLISNLILWAIFFVGALHMLRLRDIPGEDQSEGPAPESKDTGYVEPQ